MTESQMFSIQAQMARVASLQGRIVICQTRITEKVFRPEDLRDTYGRERLLEQLIELELDYMEQCVTQLSELGEAMEAEGENLKARESDNISRDDSDD